MKKYFIKILPIIKLNFKTFTIIVLKKQIVVSYML